MSDATPVLSETAPVAVTTTLDASGVMFLHKPAEVKQDAQGSFLKLQLRHNTGEASKLFVVARYRGPDMAAVAEQLLKPRCLRVILSDLQIGFIAKEGEKPVGFLTGECVRLDVLGLELASKLKSPPAAAEALAHAA